MFKNILMFAVCISLAAFTQPSQAHQGIIKDAWIADAPPVASIRAAYLQLYNNGKHTVVIKTFSSPEFARVELHKTIVEDGMVKMDEVDKLTVKPGEHIEFKPGGYHLMLYSPKRDLHKGDKVELKMHFEDNTITPFTAIVRKRGGKMHHDHKKHQQR